MAESGQAGQKNVIENLAANFKKWRRLGLFGAFAYVPVVAAFFLGGNSVYWFTTHDTVYGGSNAIAINKRFGASLLNEHVRTHQERSGAYSYDERDVDLRTLSIKNNSSTRVVGSGDVQLIMCPFPKYFIVSNYDFAFSSSNELYGSCGQIRNVTPIYPKQLSKVYFFAPKAPSIYEDSKASTNLTSGEHTFVWQLIIRVIMWLVALPLMCSGASYLTELFGGLAASTAYKLFNWTPGKLILLPLQGIAWVVSMVALGFAIFLPINLLSEYELISDYDKGPELFWSSLQLVTPASSETEKIKEARDAGKYEVAFFLEKTFVAETERIETESIGKPGLVTAKALGSLAWHALLAQKYEEALAASERALTLAPQETWIETNQAHALLLLGRETEARALYLGKKGTRLPGKVLWEDVIRDDFDALQKVPITNPSFKEIEDALQSK